MKFTLLCLIALVVAGCSARFASMTEAELAAYNATVAPEDQVRCYQQKIGSSISRTICRTNAQFARDRQLNRIINKDPNLDIEF